MIDVAAKEEHQEPTSDGRSTKRGDTMTMPGFAAEISLYNTSHHYYTSGGLAAIAPAYNVVSATFPPCNSPSQACGFAGGLNELYCCPDGTVCCDPSCSPDSPICQACCPSNNPTCCRQTPVDDGGTFPFSGCPKDRELCGVFATQTMRAQACCPSGQKCCDPSTHACCPINTTCCHDPSGKSQCCGEGEQCTLDGCCPAGQLVCNDHCCAPGEKCTSNGCCPEGRVV